MRLDTPYGNRNLEAKRQARLYRLKADGVLRRDARQRRRTDRDAALVLTRDQPRQDRSAAERLAAAVMRSRLLESRETALALRRVVYWHRFWLRDPGDWRASSHNPRRQLGSLLRHLLARYEVPGWFDEAFVRFEAPTRKGRGGREQAWFLHVARGGNLRTAADLPLGLTKKQAHHAMNAPCDGIVEAIRWGQSVSAGASPALARAICGTFLGRGLGTCDQEAFWQEAIGWLAREAGRAPLFHVREAGPLLDFLRAQKYEPQGLVWRDGRFVDLGPPQPGLRMKGRTLQALLRQMRQWHDQLGRGEPRSHVGRMTWPSSGIAGGEFVEGEEPEQRRVVIHEMRTGAELIEEGRRMRHCVASYVRYCAQGSTAIFGLRVEEAGQGLERRATIEVDVGRRRITQVQGRCNAAVGAIELRWLRSWATQMRLEIAEWVTRAGR